MVAIGEGPETKALLDFVRPMYALYVGGMGARGKNFYNDLACQYGFEKEAKEIQDLYLDGKKHEAAALVPTEWLEAGNLVGPGVLRQGAASPPSPRPASPSCRSPPDSADDPVRRWVAAGRSELLA